MPAATQLRCMLRVGVFLLAAAPIPATAAAGKAVLSASSIVADARSLLPWLQHHRRELHRIPELAFEETRTAAYLQRELKALAIPFRKGVAGTGIIATLGSGSPRVALRTDIDALPIREANDVDYVSRFPGQMHACGHDAHMAMLLGAARMLKSREADLRGTVVLLFQPAEESRGGAQDMIGEGALEGVSAIAGIHVWPDSPSGTITTKAGAIMAASDRFNITVEGVGGHAGLPHRTRDPVVAAAAVVGALQPLVSRETPPTDGAVVSVSRFNTGVGASNVIPDAVEMLGTIRALTGTHFATLRRRVGDVAAAVAGAHGCIAHVDWSPRPYLPTVNDAGLVNLVAGVARQVAAFEVLQEPSMAAEDFSFYSDKIPGVFTFLGIRNKTADSMYALHRPKFTMDEQQLPTGAALHTTTALHMLDLFGKDSSATAAAGFDEL